MKKIAIASLVLLSGCAGFYAEPRESSPHADVMITRQKDERFQTGGLQQFLVYDNDSCTSSKGEILANLNYLAGDAKQARVPVGNRLYIKAVTLGFRHGLYKCEGDKFCVVNDTCINLVSFVPESGKLYALQQDLALESCKVRLVDQALNSSPESLLVHPVGGQCAR